MTDDKVTRGEDAESLQEQVEEKIEEVREQKLCGTFGGVFTPTLLTILSVIMYLHEGWVVGNTGLLGAWIIILMSFINTGFTGFSLSSITTNIRTGRFVLLMGGARLHFLHACSEPNLNPGGAGDSFGLDPSSARGSFPRWRTNSLVQASSHPGRSDLTD